MESGQLHVNFLETTDDEDEEIWVYVFTYRINDVVVFEWRPENPEVDVWNRIVKCIETRTDAKGSNAIRWKGIIHGRHEIIYDSKSNQITIMFGHYGTGSGFSAEFALPCLRCLQAFKRAARHNERYGTNVTL